MIENVLEAMQSFNESDMQITTWPKCVIVHNSESSVLIKITTERDKLQSVVEAIAQFQRLQRGIAACVVDAENITQSERIE